MDSVPFNDFSENCVPMIKQEEATDHTDTTEVSYI